MVICITFLYFYCTFNCFIASDGQRVKTMCCTSWIMLRVDWDYCTFKKCLHISVFKVLQFSSIPEIVRYIHIFYISICLHSHGYLIDVLHIFLYLFFFYWCSYCKWSELLFGDGNLCPEQSNHGLVTETYEIAMRSEQIFLIIFTLKKILLLPIFCLHRMYCISSSL